MKNVANLRTFSFSVLVFYAFPETLCPDTLVYYIFILFKILSYTLILHTLPYFHAFNTVYIIASFCTYIAPRGIFSYPRCCR